MTTKDFRYVILEDEIVYDWDDYDLWGAVLYDTQENKIVTSKYGHGTDLKERKESIELDEAKNIDIEKLINLMVDALGIGMPDLHQVACNSLEKPTSIPVKVVRGRKFKGDGYLVYAEREPVRYGLGAYKNEYHEYPVIYDPKTKTFNRVNSFGYLEISDEVKSFFVNAARKHIENTLSSVRSLAHAWAYNMSYSACDRDNYLALIDRYSRAGFADIDVADCVKEGIDILNEEKRIARQKLMDEKLPGILDWVKKNTDKEGDEIMELAIHIFNKYN